MAIVLNNVTTGYNVSTINSNFQKIEDYVNDKLLARDATGVAGEAMMSRPLDMNGNKILNIFVDVNDAGSLLTVGEADSRYYNVEGDSLTGTMNVNGQAVINLPQPSIPSQAVPKNYVDVVSNTGDERWEKTLRFPDSINPMSPSIARADSIQGYNSAGNPVPIFAMTDTADLAIKLASHSAGLGASLIGTEQGETAQNFISTQILNSYAELKDTTPTYAGQIVATSSYYSDWASAGWLGPRGGNRYVAVEGSVTDDGGFLCQPTGTTLFHWRLIKDELNLFDFGVKFSDRTISGGLGLRETSVQLQNAINSAIVNKLPLVSSAFVHRSGYANGQSLYVNTGIDITGIKTIRGILALIYKPSEIVTKKPLFDDDPNGFGYVVLNTNWTWGSDGKMFGTSLGEQDIDTITTYSLEGRNSSYPVHGQLHGFSGSKIKMLASIHNYGYGVRLADCYDSVVDDVRGLFSGVVDQTLGFEYSGVSLNSYTKPDSTSSTDETNAMRVTSLMAHNCYDLAWVCSGSKNNIGAVHEEATYVTTTWRSNPSASLNNNGYGYYNSAFTSLGGFIGCVDINPTSGNLYDHTFSAMPWGTTFGVINGQNVGCPAGYTPEGGFISEIRGKSLFIRGNARVTIGKVGLSGNLTSQDDASTILQGNISGSISVAGNSAFRSLFVSGTVSVTSGAPKFEACHLNGVNTFAGEPKMVNCVVRGATSLTAAAQVSNTRFTSTLSVSSSSQLDNCHITGAVTSTSNEAIFGNCRLLSTFSGGGSLSNCRITGAISTADSLTLRLVDVFGSGALNITGTNIQVYIQGGRYDTGTIDSAATGVWQLFPCPQFNTSFGTWKNPTIVSGFGRMTVNPLTNKILTLVGGSWAEYTTH
jgi:hypothetical protein